MSSYFALVGERLLAITSETQGAVRVVPVDPRGNPIGGVGFLHRGALEGAQRMEHGPQGVLVAVDDPDPNEPVEIDWSQYETSGDDDHARLVPND